MLMPQRAAVAGGAPAFDQFGDALRHLSSHQFAAVAAQALEQSSPLKLDGADIRQPDHRVAEIIDGQANIDASIYGGTAELQAVIVVSGIDKGRIAAHRRSFDRRLPF